MRKNATVIGYGKRGRHWVRRAVGAGWSVRVFDPEGALENRHPQVTQHDLISTAVAGAHWIVLCLPDRLALHRKVIQHIQTVGDADTTLAVMSEISNAEDLQGCAKWPGSVLHVDIAAPGLVRLNVTAANAPGMIDEAGDVLAALGFEAQISGLSVLAAE